MPMTVQDERLLSVEFVCDIWLGVLDDPPAYNEIRAFWNVKENRGSRVPSSWASMVARLHQRR
jgi:hypothetical protein